jgi:hypothetical protein
MLMRPAIQLRQHACAPLLAVASIVACGVCFAQQVQRCESPDGKVTYSNTKCPDGSSPVRSVNTSPPVAVDEQKAAKERAKRDADEAKAIDKARAKEETQAQRAAADQKKAQAKELERCEKAKRELAQAMDASAALHRKSATIQQMQKADGDIAKREAEVKRSCPG